MLAKIDQALAYPPCLAHPHSTKHQAPKPCTLPLHPHSTKQA